MGEGHVGKIYHEKEANKIQGSRVWQVVLGLGADVRLHQSASEVTYCVTKHLIGYCVLRGGHILWVFSLTGLIKIPHPVSHPHSVAVGNHVFGSGN